MSIIRRLTQVLGLVSAGALGTLLILEVTDRIGTAWREELADAAERLLEPTWALWLSGLVGAAMAAVGVGMVGAQFAPEKRGFRTVHSVHRDDDGATRLRGRAAIVAVEHELAAIDGVVEVTASIRRKTVLARLLIDDRAAIDEIENAARSSLDHAFWIDLGLADYSLDLIVAHHPRPPRVR